MIVIKKYTQTRRNFRVYLKFLVPFSLFEGYLIYFLLIASQEYLLAS